MANTHETLTGLFTDIAGAIRAKTGGTGAIAADQFPEAIAAIDTQENLDAELSAQDSLIEQISTAIAGKTGVALPTLSNPAGAENIEAGYQAIDGAGKLIEGALSGLVLTKTDAKITSTGKYTVYGTSNVPDVQYPTCSNLVKGEMYILVDTNGYLIGYGYAYDETNLRVALWSKEKSGNRTIAINDAALYTMK